MKFAMMLTFVFYAVAAWLFIYDTFFAHREKDNPFDKHNNE